MILRKMIPLFLLLWSGVLYADAWKAVEECRCSDAIQKVVYPFYSASKPTAINFGEVTRVGYRTAISAQSSTISFDNLANARVLIQKAHRYRAKVDLVITLPTDIGVKEEKTGFAIDNLVYNIGKSVSHNGFDGVTIDFSDMVTDSLSRNYSHKVIYSLMKRLKKEDNSLYLNVVIPQSFSEDKLFFNQLKNIEDFVNYIFIDMGEEVSITLPPELAIISQQKIVPLLSQKEQLSHIKENSNIGGVAFRGEEKISLPIKSATLPAVKKQQKALSEAAQAVDTGSLSATDDTTAQGSDSTVAATTSLDTTISQKKAAVTVRPPDSITSQKESTVVPDITSKQPPFEPVQKQLVTAGYTLYYSQEARGINGFFKQIICPNRVLFSGLLYLIISLYLTILLVAFFDCKTAHIIGRYQSWFFGAGGVLSIGFLLMILYDSVGNFPRYLILITLLLFIITYLIRLDSDRKMSRNSP